VLPAPSRLTRGADFQRVVRTGRRAGGRLLVVHVAPCEDQPDHPVRMRPRVGFITGRVVGNAVIRHRVQRRLRHLVRERLAQLPSVDIVVRALAGAAGASYQELGAELDRCLQRALGHGQESVS
jgi:ribonuclease P protein component